MKDKPNSPSQPTGQSGRPRASQRGGRRGPPRRSPRTKQLLAVGALVLILAVVAGVVFFSQQSQAPTSASGHLPGEENGHARGSATASVVVTEWSDFQ